MSANTFNYWNSPILYLNKKRLTKGEFEYLVNNYYNEYYATEAITQRRRQLRNLKNNNQSIRKANYNPFVYEKNFQTYFYYMNTYTYKYLVYPLLPDGRRKVHSYVLINSAGNFCDMGCFYLNPGQNLADYVNLCYNGL